MNNMFAFFFRLFMPLLVVTIVIGGVRVGVDALHSVQDRQAALTIAHASGCPVGGVPVTSCTPPGPPSKGGKDGLPCAAVVPVAGTVTGTCISGCCWGQDWPGAVASGQSQGFLSGLGDSVTSLAKGVAEGVATMGLMQMLTGQGGDSVPGVANYEKAPVCESLTASPDLISPGESSTLTWTLGGGTPEAIMISPSVGLTSGYSTRVAPEKSTTYTVTVRNRIGSSECPTVRVHVGAESFSDAEFTGGSAGSGDEFDIWGVGSGDAQSDTSPYDNLSVTNNNINTNVNTNEDAFFTEDDEYYAFLESLGGAEGDELSLDGVDEYYYSDDSAIDWSLFADEGWESDSFVLDESAYEQPVADGNIINNPSGLTDKEIYGVWSRPESPVSSGFGLATNDYGSNAEAPDLSGESNPSVFARFFAWLRGIFCFWCDAS